jgi:hypothetical protein
MGALTAVLKRRHSAYMGTQRLCLLKHNQRSAFERAATLLSRPNLSDLEVDRSLLTGGDAGR